MDLIVPKQIRAARSYLGLTQSQVAKALSVTKTTVANWENDSYSIPLEKMKQIKNFFLGHNIKFIEGKGFIEDVREIEVLQGDIGMRAFFDKIYDFHSRPHKDICCVLGAEERMFWNHLDFAGFHTKRMREIKARMRAIVDIGSVNNLQSYCEYRTMPPKYFDGTPIYIFGDNVGIIVWNKMEVIHMHNPVVAAAFYKMFNFIWDGAEVMKSEK